MKALRGSIRWAHRDVRRTYRVMVDLSLDWIRAPTPRHAALLLPRVHAAEIAHQEALARLQSLKSRHRYSWENEGMAA